MKKFLILIISLSLILLSSCFDEYYSSQYPNTRLYEITISGDEAHNFYQDTLENRFFPPEELEKLVRYYYIRILPTGVGYVPKIQEIKGCVSSKTSFLVVDHKEFPIKKNSDIYFPKIGSFCATYEMEEESYLSSITIQCECGVPLYHIYCSREDFYDYYFTDILAGRTSEKDPETNEVIYHLKRKIVCIGYIHEDGRKIGSLIYISFRYKDEAEELELNEYEQEIVDLFIDKSFENFEKIGRENFMILQEKRDAQYAKK